MTQPKNDVFATPEILDVTAVEVAKVKESGETDRKKIAEIEQTKRCAIDRNVQKWSDSGFQWTVGLSALCFFVCVFGCTALYAGCVHERPAAAAPPPLCAESVQIIRSGDKPAACTPGAAMNVKLLENARDTQVECICPIKK